MINPQPVQTPRSPYSSGDSGPRPTIAQQLPQKTEKPRVRGRISWKRTMGIFLMVIIFGAFAYAYSQYRSLANNVIVEHEGDTAAILDYNPEDNNLDTSKFVKAGDGLFTMVLVGVGGESHPGGNLTDSIQVVSMDTINNSVSFTSVPRDLYVNVAGYGRTKINAVYYIGEQKKAGQGAVLLKETISSILGTKVSNFGLIDFTGIQQIVDSLGGIEVTVPKALSDPFYPAPDMIHYDPFSVQAGLQKMDGKTALKYSRSRETTSDFDRSARQQIVIEAIKKKALSAGVLTNPTKVSALVSALGKHFKTDLQVDDLKTLIGVYQKITSENTKGYVLDTSSALGLLTSSTSQGTGYISYPIQGYDKYAPIHEWFAKNNPDPLLKRDKPTVTVYASNKATKKQIDAFVEQLEDYGYTVTVSTQTISKLTALKVTARDLKAKQISTNYLGSLLGKSVEKGTIGSNVSTDYEVYFVPSATAANVSASPSPKTSLTPKASPSPSSTP